MKLLLAIFLSLTLTSFTACSINSGNLEYLNAVANFGLLNKQDPQVNSLYQKYSKLLNEAEKVKAVETYEAIKKAGEGVNLETPINYLVAKSMYFEITPLYAKYKDQIEKPDQVIITGIHQKLKSISEAIDKAIDDTIKNDLTLEYFRTASLLIGAFA